MRLSVRAKKDSRRRRGTTTMEIIIAVALLGIAASLMGQFAIQVRQGLRDRELNCRCDWELLNLRERIGSWSLDQVTTERIAQVEVSEPLRKRLTEPKFKALVARVDQPTPALQVTIGLEAVRDGQVIQPSTLTFWIVDEGGES